MVSFPIYDDYNTTGHKTTLNDLSTVVRGEQNLTGSSKEAIFIKFKHLSPNRNTGKHNLPCIGDEVLLNSLELKLK